MERLERERVALGIYEGLSPQEKRERLVLSPTYRSAYNRLLDNEDRMTLPRYFWRKWLPVLGAEASSLYVVLRDLSQVEAKGSDSWCWPEQADLGRRIGVSPKPLRRALKLLEEHGFIRSSRRREQLPGKWQEVQGTNHYEVFLDIPLTAKDAVELLLEEMSEHVGSSDGQFDLQSENRPASLRVNSTARASEGHFDPQRNEEIQGVSSSGGQSDPLNVSNVTNLSNVRDSGEGRTPLRDHPAVKNLSPAERQARATLAAEIGETLSRMTGSREGGPHRSLGLHRRLAFLMGPALVKEALAATRDAVEAKRSGRKAFTGSVDAYFAGIAFGIAERERIDLGVRRKGGGGEAPREPRTHGSMAPRPPARTPRNPERTDEGERARVGEMLRTLVRSLEPLSSRPR